jgi:hypothetical protein
VDYQTTPLPDGTVLPGLFPSDIWFKEISSHVDFNNKSVLDIGCCNCSYGFQAIDAGANFYTGIEIESPKVLRARDLFRQYSIQNVEILHQDIKTFFPERTYDISIFGLIIYWIDCAEYQIKRIVDLTSGKIIFIFRLGPLDGTKYYQPSVPQLSKLIGRTPFVHSTVMHTQEQLIDLVIYDTTI